MLFPRLIPELVNVQSDARYAFSAPTLKALEKRLDGLLLPESNDQALPVIFVEARMQPDVNLYRRIHSQLAIYLYQYNVDRPWKTVVIYPDRKTEHLGQPQVSVALDLTTIYLDELEDRSEVEWQCLHLIIQPPKDVLSQARRLVVEARTRPDLSDKRFKLIDLVTAIITRKFPDLSNREITKMLNLVPLEQTRAYKEVREESLQKGRQEGRQEGLLEGREEGRQEAFEEANLKFARKLLQEGMDVEDVARLSELTVEQVRSLQ